MTLAVLLAVKRAGAAQQTAVRVIKVMAAMAMGAYLALGVKGVGVGNAQGVFNMLIAVDIAHLVAGKAA